MAETRIVGNRSKPTGAAMDFTIDWAADLGTDTISSSAWAVAPTGLSIGTDSHTTTKTTVRLSGGTAGARYLVTNTVVTVGGQTLIGGLLIDVGARVGMMNLILALRRMTNAEANQDGPAGLTFWTDEQMQEELDRTQVYLRGVALTLLPVVGMSGQYQYFDYAIPGSAGKWFEELSGADAGWALKDTQGAVQATTLYSVNYAARRITFTSDQASKLFYLDARAYDLNKAAAEIWRQKAAMLEESVDFATDNHDIKASQQRQHCLEMAKFYDKKSGIQVSRMVRTDEVWRL